MPNDNENIFPFSQKQLVYFKEELADAGSFEKLMVIKEALEENERLEDVITYNDIEGYKKKYLVGVYKPLRLMYDTEIPYIFWSEMYQTLLRVDASLE